MIWFSSDWHLGHSNILKYSNRPFNNVVDMDDHIIENINKCVKQTDILWFLGDFCFSRYKWEYGEIAKGYADRINCSCKYLIFGNHDRNRLEIAKNFVIAQDLTRIKIFDHDVILCHYAMAIWEKQHYGSWHLYGHSHAGDEDYLDKIMPNRRSMDIGIDNAYRLKGKYEPFSWDEIKSILGAVNDT